MCGILHRVCASRGPVKTNGGSCLIPTPHASITITPPPSAQYGTGHRAAISSPWPSCRPSSSTPTPPIPVPQEGEEAERQLTTARDGTVGSAGREAPPPPSIRSSLINRAAERRQTGKMMMSDLTGTGREQPAKPSGRSQVEMHRLQNSWPIPISGFKGGLTCQNRFFRYRFSI